MMHVGVVGLGNMGSAFARTLLQRGLHVHGYDLDPKRTAALASAGGAVARSAAEAAAEAEVVITSLPSAEALQSVVAQLATADSRLVVVETSTLSLASKELARSVLEDNGHVLLDCPVSGTGAQARAGDVVLYASGEHDACQRCVPVFDGFCRAHHYVGPFGTGTKLKLIANLLVSIHNVAAAEAIVLGRKAGIDLDLLVDVIADGAGSSRMFEVRGPVMAAGTYDRSTADLTLYRKDLALIVELAAKLDCPVPLLAAATQVYTAALAQGRGRQDGAAVHAVMAQMAGLPVDSPRAVGRSQG